MGDGAVRVVRGILLGFTAGGTVSLVNPAMDCQLEVVVLVLGCIVLKKSSCFTWNWGDTSPV